MIFLPLAGNSAHAGSLVGSEIEFGQYAQDDSGTKTPIKFVVLDETENKVLVISSKGIDALPFNNEDADVSWETSSIRSWLNNEFMTLAFTKDEENFIVKSKIKTLPNPLYPLTNSVETSDFVFLLSYDEAESYFLLPEDRIAIMTDKVKKAVFADKNGEGDWWLRTSGGKLNRASYVRDFGDIQAGGSKVCDEAISVRPAMWLRKSYLETL